jgi:hypothetical protein
MTTTKATTKTMTKTMTSLSKNTLHHFAAFFTITITLHHNTITGLQHPDNYHEFCRLLGRLKSNYQLTELMAAPLFVEWLELVCRFSEQSFSQWHVSANSLVYILQLWVRLVAAVPCKLWMCAPL